MNFTLMNFTLPYISFILKFGNHQKVIEMRRNRGLQQHLLFIVLSFGLFSSVWAETVPDNEPLTVTLLPLASVLQASARSVPATLLSVNDSTLGAEVTGKVTRLAVDVGTTVKAGQVLASLDCRDYTHGLSQAKASMSAAKARLSFAQRQWQRNQQLRKTGLLPAEQLEKTQADFEGAQAEVAVAQAQVDTAALAVSRCDMTAPFAGQITQRHLQLGQQATPGTPAFQLLQDKALEVSASLSVDEVQDQTQGAALRFVADGVSIPLERRAVVGQIAGNTRTQEVRFTLKGEHSLPVGRSGRVVWQGKLQALPASWVVRREGGLGVMLEVDGMAKFHPLPDAKEGQPVLTDLPTSVRLIDQNRLRARDGQAVTVEKP
jgi:RND family efflux transporter MFP subunit